MDCPQKATIPQPAWLGLPKVKPPAGEAFKNARFQRTNYFFAVSAFAASALAASLLAYLRRKRSTRPAVSMSFCLPVKNGWQAEQISTPMSPLWVERVINAFPQAQCTRISLYWGWIAVFMSVLNLRIR